MLTNAKMRFNLIYRVNYNFICIVKMSRRKSVYIYKLIQII